MPIVLHDIPEIVQNRGVVFDHGCSKQVQKDQIDDVANY